MNQLRTTRSPCSNVSMHGSVSPPFAIPRLVHYASQSSLPVSARSSNVTNNIRRAVDLCHKVRPGTPYMAILSIRDIVCAHCCTCALSPQSWHISTSGSKVWRLILPLRCRYAKQDTQKLSPHCWQCLTATCGRTT